MKAILTSFVAGSLLATLAAAQSPRCMRATRRSADTPASASPLAYVITGGLQFGALDLHSGAFLPIGPGIPSDVGGGLVPGRGRSLLTLAFSGNLDAIDPATGVTSVLGATGLGDCSTPTSPCLGDSALVIGRLDGNFYATDFDQNLYSVDPVTGAATLIGSTGIPRLPFVPFSPNSDCQNCVNVYGASLFSFRGKLYAYFATAVLNLDNGTVIANPISGELYQLNVATGQATPIASTDSNLTQVVNVNDTIYGFDAAAGQVVTLDLTNGQSTFVSNLDPAAGVIGGATPARPASVARH
jgi:hypothetical protein